MHDRNAIIILLRTSRREIKIGYVVWQVGFQFAGIIIIKINLETMNTDIK